MVEDKQLNKKVPSPFQMMPSRLNGLAPRSPPALAVLRAAALLTSPLLLFN